jgi:hypothetical protein
MAIPYLPGAYNWWRGNEFKIPALGEYARPVYADALQGLAETDPGARAALPGAAPASFGTSPAPGTEQGGFADRTAPSLPGIGMNAVTTDWRDMIAGPISAPLSIFGQSVINELRGNPSRPITGVGLSDIWGAIQGDPGPQDLTGQGQGYTYEEAQSPGSIANSPETGGREGDRSTPADFSTPSYEYSKGGPVKGLIGPNPPGPDEGLGALQRDEFVVKKSAARKHRGLLEDINDDGKIDKKRRKGLLR